MTAPNQIAADLLDLAKRCEEAAGPDRRMDAEIGRAVSRPTLPRYTSSLDAAMTLVPEGWDWFVSTTGPEGDERPYALVGDTHTETDTSKGSSAATPALALCAAALRARAAMEGGEA